jgi:hypothetical protein
MAKKTEKVNLAEGTDFKESDAAVAVAEGAAPKKEKVLIPDIIRGRMPIAIVYAVRFGELRDGKIGDLAKQFGTTIGKITDIKKGSTFGYLGSSFKPTQLQKDDAIAWLKKHVAYEDGAVDIIINEVEAMDVATAEETAAFEATRIAHKGQTTTTKEGKPANAGGGNRTKAPKKEEVAGEKLSAGDLL